MGTVIKNTTTTTKLIEKTNKRLVVKYRRNYYDITEFVKKHPGGLNTLRSLQNFGDMTASFEHGPPHSKAAMYLMQEYKISPPPTHKDHNNNNNITDRVVEQAQDHDVNSIHKMLDDRGIELLKHDDDNDHDNEEDASLEHLVDWNKAMLPQISQIVEHYDDWVHKPVDRKLRLFDAWYLELLTETPWWLVPLFWLPIIAKCLHDGIKKSSNFGQLAFIFACGLLLWTLLEYSLHRWVFHMRVTGRVSGWLCTSHFLIHGLHHKVPYDPNRLVFPPLPGALIAVILYTPLSFISPHPRILLAGALCGYLAYDMMHYYLHYGNPSIRHFYYMKRYHYQHHFSHQQVGFGISSPLWDYVFNTKIHLRKLRYKLKWK